MYRNAIFSIVVFVSLFVGISAQAEISTFSIFPVRGFQTAGSTINGAAILGNDPSSTATFNGGGTVLLDFGEDISDHTFTISATGVIGGPATVAVRFVFTTPGAPAFTDTAPAGLFPGPAPTDFVFTIDGAGDFALPNGIFSTSCGVIGGCNSVLLNVTSAAGFTANILSAAPEPASWILMIMGFAGVAARLKTIRRQSQTLPANQLPAMA